MSDDEKILKEGSERFNLTPEAFKELRMKYPFLSKYTSLVKKPQREIVGRDEEMRSILAAFNRPELSNVLLLAEAGVGKTALVQKCSVVDMSRIYLEVHLSKMIADSLVDVNQMAEMLRSLFDEVSRYSIHESKEAVLFIDEFHQIVQLSDAAVEVLKPLLADSGTRSIRVVAATTYGEFREYVSSNQPLVERLQRINLSEPNKKTTVSILKGMAETYGISHLIPSNYLYEQIYELANRYIPSSSQPRKSIKLLDDMVGWHRAERRQIDMKLLAHVLYQSEGVNIAFRVDPTSIKEKLDSRVYAQDFATSAIEERLQICIADLNDKTKPMSSFLFTGSTGVGKSILDADYLPIYDPDGKLFRKKMGDIEIGDYVYMRNGKPGEVSGVFPQGYQEVWEVEFSDGRVQECSPDHLWLYQSRVGNGAKFWKTKTTKELYYMIDRLKIAKGRNQKPVEYMIPMNDAVDFPEIQGRKCNDFNDYKLDPYILGVLIADGCLTLNQLEIVTSDLDVIEKVSKRLGTSYHELKSTSYHYNFYCNDYWKKMKSNQKYIRTSDLLSYTPELLGKYSNERFIPDEYKYGSVKQRFDLIHGLFDSDGSISKDNRHHVLYSSKSERLVHDIQEILWSLGIQSRIRSYIRNDDIHDDKPEYTLQVMIEDSNKYKLFSTPQKLEICKEAAKFEKTKTRVKKYDRLGIREIRKTDRKERMTCILVDDDEHLFLTENYIVTHNTEICKVLAEILFEDRSSLIRFDMSEYAGSNSLDRFRVELTNAMWQKPYSILLLDEVEKADASITRLLLQVLDDGRLVDQNGRVVSFLNAYIIMTTNAGSSIYQRLAQYTDSTDGSEEGIKRFDRLIRTALINSKDGTFPPELLGRVDMIIPFQPLQEETYEKIMKKYLVALKRDLKNKHKVDVAYDAKLIRYIIKDKYNIDTNSGGARGLTTVLEREVTTPISRFINSHPDESKIYLAVEGDLATDNKKQLKSQAFTIVKPVRA